MKKRRFLAILLAACMAVESTLTVFATDSGVFVGGGTSMPSANIGETDDETLTEEVEQPTADGITSEEETDTVVSEDAVQETDGTVTENPNEGSGAVSGEDSEVAPEEEPPIIQEVPETEEGQVTDVPAVAMALANEEGPIGFVESDGEEFEIYDLKISGHMYGSVEMVWKYNKIKEDITTDVQGFNIYRSNDPGEGYEWISSDPLWDGVKYTYEDDTVEHQDNTVENKIYYYKIGVVYDKYEGNNPVRTESRSDYVTNEGWSNYLEYRLDQLESDNKSIDDTQYIGGCIVDENTQKLDEIEVREGETIKLSIAYISKDGKETPVLASKIDAEDNNWGNWYICDQYNSYNDISESQQVSDSKIRLSYVAPNHEAEMTALPGAARDDVYYLSMVTTNWLEATYMWQIPVHVVEGDGNYDDDIWDTNIYDSREELEQAIRDALVNREEESVFYSVEEVAFEWWDYDNLQKKDPENWWSVAGDNFDHAIFDAYRERPDMKPYEGDYLWHALGDPYEDFSLFTLFSAEPELVNNEWRTKYVVTPIFITSKEQEAKVTERINQIVHTPGGALYNYRNADDYEKIKAAFNYVRKNVGYIGTTTPIYHTCYSALFNKKATCQGYALLYYRLLRELGIPNKILMGTDPAAHGYNIVKLGNSWYYADTTSGAFLLGENDFAHAELQLQFLTSQFKAAYLSKIPKASYSKAVIDETTKSKLLKPEELTDDEIHVLDDNLVAVSSRMSANYTIKGSSIQVSGTVQYVQRCTNYLGYQKDKGMPTSGYFLAMKIKAEDHDKFDKEQGHITIYYPGDEGVQEKDCTEEYIENGYVNVILNVTDDPEIKIAIDYDGNGKESEYEEPESEYEETAYSLDFSGLTKEEKAKSAGSVEVLSEYGIRVSTPDVAINDDGSKIDVSYDVVVHSSAVELPDKGKTSGHYVALKLNVPGAVKGTQMLTDYGVNISPNEGNDGSVYIGELSEDESYIPLVIRVDGSFTEEFTIKWCNGHAGEYVQNLTVTVPADCVLVNENALQPSSIAFNGLVSTMYVGQSQSVSVTLKKKYEQDDIQVYFTSSNPDVIEINRVTGVMEAVGVGPAEIKVAAVSNNADENAKPTQKTAKITVKDLTAPASIKISNTKDTSVTVSWKANTTVQYTEVYAIPCDSAISGSAQKEWKNVIEAAMQEAGMGETMLALLKEEEKEEKLAALANALEVVDDPGVGSCVADSVTSDNTSLMIKDLHPGKEYIFYVRNISKTAAGEIVSSGVISPEVTTYSVIFDSIELSLKSGDETIYPLDSAVGGANDAAVFEISEEMWTQMKAADKTYMISYALMKDGEDITEGTTFTKPTFKSSNTKIVSLTAVEDDPTSVTLNFGAQVGDVKIYVTGKDSSGTAWESAPITIRKTNKPSGLKNKTTTLTIGQSISIKELIATDLAGTIEGIDLSELGFETALNKIKESGYFEISYSSAGEGAENAIITAAKLVDGKSGKSVMIPFSMGDPEAPGSSADATIKINDMAAPAISKVTVKDTSATIQFKPSAAVTEWHDDERYYTVILTDTVTKDVWYNELDKGEGYTCNFTPDPTNPGTVWTCEIGGLSSSKAYTVVIVAHCDAADIGTDREECNNYKESKSSKFTTSKPLLASEGRINLKYIDLEDLRASSDNGKWEDIIYVSKDMEGNESTTGESDDKIINLENNGTYVFMAQISDLARILETDKLKWAISSGDKKAGTIKATSSTYEMQLTTTKIGTFTVTATSTLSKEVLVTFVVNVIPYQSNSSKGTDDLPTGNSLAYLPEIETGLLLKEEREDVA